MVLFDPKRIARQGTAAYVRSLADDQKQNLTGGQLRNLTGDKVRFHNRGLNLISESGLYKLVMRSDKKEAKQFQDWVTREVLPSIRKTGTYTMPGAKKAIEAPQAANQHIVVALLNLVLTHTIG